MHVGNEQLPRSRGHPPPRASAAARVRAEPTAHPKVVIGGIASHSRHTVGAASRISRINSQLMMFHTSVQGATTVLLARL